MTMRSRLGASPSGLSGRGREIARLDDLVAALRQGESRVLLLRGDAGIGKTALLDHLVARSSGLRILRATGVESEMELAFASLHQLCAPILGCLDRLPDPQREALEVAFGTRSGPPPNLFLVGLAVLGLLTQATDAGPVLCVVDDAQWLDSISVRTLAFVARRLMAEPLAMVFAAREADDVLGGLPQLEVRGLSDRDARTLLGAAVPFLQDEDVLGRIIAETRGNPLALLELPHGMDAAQLAGAFGRSSTRAVSGRLEEAFLDRLEGLPEQSRLLLLVAAAEPVGDPLLVREAGERLGIASSTATGAILDDLLAIDHRVTFRHPLVRSAIYRSSTGEQRRAVHQALAAATDHERDPDRRAWHLAGAAAGPDEAVAQELERSAVRAQARGGFAAAAALLERSVALSEDLTRRVDRILAAGEAALHAGSFDVVSKLLVIVGAEPLDDLQRARVEMLRAELAFSQRRGADAPSLLLRAARMLERLDPPRARETYLDAWGAALFAGPLASGGDLDEVSRAARGAPSSPARPTAADLLLDALAAVYAEGRPAATPLLRRAADVFVGDEVTTEEVLRWGWMATAAGILRWDYETGQTIARRGVDWARTAGALTVLSVSLNVLCQVIALSGDLDGASDVLAEADAVISATGMKRTYSADMVLAALRGREQDAFALIDAVVQDARASGQGTSIQYADWARATVLNGHGRFREALAPALRASEGAPEFFFSNWARVEAIEASARSGRPEVASGLLDVLAQHTQVCGTDWAIGIEARSRALLSERDEAERLYRDAIMHLGVTRQRHELGRAHLVYGEWLRRQNRRLDARDHLRTAYDTLADIGMEAFAERARLELRATGERARRRRPDTRDELTAQERQIAMLAAERLSNTEIGGRLFLSHRTIEWHLHKIYGKLGISSRRELAGALRGAGSVRGT